MLDEDINKLAPLDPVRLRRDLDRAISSTAMYPRHKPYAATGVYCPGCGVDRRVTLTLLYHFDKDHEGVGVPALAYVYCLQCQMTGVVTLYQGPNGLAVSTLWPKIAGLSTPKTPASVAYYLDQAARCESSNANSAAVAMYRAALDHLLFEHGYTKGMLGARINELLDDVDKGTAPKWALELDHAYLGVIKDLGNGAIHTNDGDVTKQDLLDGELIAHLHAVFAELLDVVYEEPARRAQRLLHMQSVASTFRK